MKNITLSELREKLFAQKSALPITIIAHTKPEMRRMDNPFINAKKVQRLNGMIASNYQNAVNNIGNKEGNEQAGQFKSAPRTWGEHISPCLIEHKGETYLSIQSRKSLDVQYVQDGEKIEKNLIKPFLPEKNPSKRQKDFGNEKEVVWRTFNLTNIKMISMNKEHYLVI